MIKFYNFSGTLGDCWFLSAACVLAGCKDILAKVIPERKDQILDPDVSASGYSDRKDLKTYEGIFRCKFFHRGKWLEVLVDDRLPTIINDAGEDELFFSHSRENHEYWVPLLEKGYAK